MLVGDCKDHALLFGLGGLVVGAATAFAIYYGPIAGVKKQRKLDDEREAKNLEREMLRTDSTKKSGPPVLPRF